ncbi:MAG: exopolysaccharide biosynthesis protein [Candidatus Methylacidiphilales bacterium]|nr:exopolysaccharide biosynthesis protein [Candidatus Methylacidiphilales bacterium]
MSHYDQTLQHLDHLATLNEEKNLSVGKALDELEISSFDFLCILLTVPFLQPISLGPLSAIGGMTFAALGWQMARRQSKPWLPESIRKIELPGASWKVLLLTCRKVLQWGHRICRPRLQRWVEGARMEQFRGILICLAGLLMAIPFFGVPFNNTLPALVILFACLANLEDDGLMILVALFWMVLTVLYFGLIFWIVFFVGEAAWEWMRAHGLGWFGDFVRPEKN